MIELPWIFRLLRQGKKIDAAVCDNPPTAGSLADIIRKYGSRPFTNFATHTVADVNYETALEITDAAGEVRVIGWTTAGHGHAKITVDGTVVFEGEITHGSSYNGCHLGDWRFSTSFKIEHKVEAASGEDNTLYLSYYIL